MVYYEIVRNVEVVIYIHYSYHFFVIKILPFHNWKLDWKK